MITFECSLWLWSFPWKNPRWNYPQIPSSNENKHAFFLSGNAVFIRSVCSSKRAGRNGLSGNRDLFIYLFLCHQESCCVWFLSLLFITMPKIWIGHAKQFLIGAILQFRSRSSTQTYSWMMNWVQGTAVQDSGGISFLLQLWLFLITANSRRGVNTLCVGFLQVHWFPKTMHA